MVRFTLASALFITASFVSAAPANIAKRSVIPVTKGGGSSGPLSPGALYEYNIGRVTSFNSPSRRDELDEEKRTASAPINNRDVTYTAAVHIGSVSYRLIVDTGSSNLWGGANPAKRPTVGIDTHDAFAVSYGSGSVSGTEYIGPAQLAGLTVHHQSYGSALTSSGFGGVDGIIGFGPVDLTSGTVSGVPLVPTFMDNLKSKNLIHHEVLGVYFKPEVGSDHDDANGELTLGGVDDSKFHGSISYFPKTHVPPFSNYWGINVARVTFTHPATVGPILGAHLAAIVDTGTTLILLPAPVFANFLSAAAHGASVGPDGLATFTTKPTGTFAIVFGTKSFTLTPDQYLVPFAQYAFFGFNPNFYYAWIASSGASSGLDFIIGQKFLEHYYSVYDTDHHQIGFAPRK